MKLSMLSETKNIYMLPEATDTNGHVSPYSHSDKKYVNSLLETNKHHLTVLHMHVT